MVPGAGGHILGKRRRKGNGGIVFGNLNLHRKELGRQVNLSQIASFKSGQPVLWDSETI